MADLIDRQQAIDAVAKWFYDVFGITESDGTATIFKRLRELPSAQPERKKGKWIEHNPHKWGLGIIYECSECGYEMDCEEPKYCPNCGARMEDGKNEIN